MDFAKALLAVVALVVVLPLVIIGLALVGPVGWVAAAIVLPVATLATILWLGRPRPGDGEPPGRGPE
jgi:ATP/ADP translocase